MATNPELSMSMFKGSIAALVTPFTDRGEIDLSAVDRLVDFHLENGTDGIVVAGTTGESAALAQAEFSDLLARALQRVSGRIPVLAGTGSASTSAAMDQTRRAAELGADAALIVTPYYVRPEQAGLEAHFTAIADQSEIPLILYNVPSRTAVDMLPQTVARLSLHPQIAGIKEAVPDCGRIDALVESCQKGFAILSGDDRSCLRSMRHGAQGVISVAANAAPGLVRALCAAALTENWSEAERLDGRLQALFEACMVESNPIPVKWALFEMGVARPHVRLPLTELQQEHRAPLRECLAGLGLMT